MNSTPNDWASYEGWEIFECPTCGTQWGLGTGGKFSKPPTCTIGHAPVEMEQKLDQAMPKELRDFAESDEAPRFRLGGEAA